jgi:hypothetical protein
MNQKQISIALNSISSSVEEITPSRARKLLKKNTMNRTINMKSVRAYIHEMTFGNWACNGETIIISDKGMLLDGQQRLTAIEMSGVSVASVVVYGVKKADFDTMDQGRKRTNGTILDLSGKKHGTILSASIKAVTLYNEQCTMTDHFGMQFTPRMAKAQLLKFKGIEESVALAFSHKRPLFSHTVIASLHYIFSAIDKNEGATFIRAIVTGDVAGNLELLKVREFFLDLKMNQKTKYAMNNRNYVCGVLIKSWNAWRKGDTLKDFEYTKGEQFPKAR